MEPVSKLTKTQRVCSDFTICQIILQLVKTDCQLGGAIRIKASGLCSQAPQFISVRGLNFVGFGMGQKEVDSHRYLGFEVRAPLRAFMSHQNLQRVLHHIRKSSLGKYGVRMLEAPYFRKGVAGLEVVMAGGTVGLSSLVSIW
jgi:hypothetical protein